ncbi:MAG: PUA domain-containing protein, partial [Bacteroidales bacterium]
LIILSNIDGIFTGNPNDPESELIPVIETNRNDISSYIQSSRSSFGRGGMITKYNIARKVADEGIEVIIANGKKEDILPLLLNKGSIQPCTRFLASEKPVSSIKKWIAHSDGFAKGELHLNPGATAAVLGEKAVSILPVGVTRVTGEFENDDIVKILDANGNQIGVGKISVDSKKATSLIGSKGAKPLVHYDYLYLD